MINRQKNSGALGFTLIESVVVILILVIVSAVVVPSLFPAMRRSRLNACAEQVAAHIRYVRNVAMAGGAPATGNMQIAFITGATSNYEVRSCGTGTPFLTDPLDRTNTFDGTTNFRVGLGRPPIASTRPEFQFIQFDVAPAFLVFNAAGTPFTAVATCPAGALTQLITAQEVRLSSAVGETRSIWVAPDTGSVIVQEP